MVVLFHGLLLFANRLPADIGGAYGRLERSGKVAWGLAWCSLLLPTLYCRFLSDQSSSSLLKDGQL